MRPITQDKISRMVIVFVDDTEFYSSRLKSKIEMQKIMDKHINLN